MMRLIGLLVLAACAEATPDVSFVTGERPPTGTATTGTGGQLVDLDGDGYADDVDCNDGNSEIHPDAIEICDDGIDNDCDELIDLDDTDECL